MWACLYEWISLLSAKIEMIDIGLAGGQRWCLTSF